MQTLSVSEKAAGDTADGDPRIYVLGPGPKAHILRETQPDDFVWMLRLARHDQWSYCGKDMSSDRWHEIQTKDAVEDGRICGVCQRAYHADEEAN